MEIYDDPNRVCPIRPTPAAYDRRYRRSSAGKELFLVGGALFLFLGGVMLLTTLAECFAAPMKTTLCLVAGCLPLFLAGGLGIRFRHYPHMAKVCFAVSAPILDLMDRKTSGIMKRNRRNKYGTKENEKRSAASV